MFLKYFFVLLKKFSDGFKLQIVWLFILSVIGGFLELLGIAMFFPVILILTSGHVDNSKAFFDCCLKFFPDIAPMHLAFIFCLVMIAIFLFKNIFMMFTISKQNEFAKNWAGYVNKKVVDKLLYASYENIQKLTYGDKSTLLFSIVRDISLDFILRCIILCANGIIALFIVVLLFYKFTVPAFLAAAFILIYAYFENLFFKKKAKQYGDVSVKLLNDFEIDVNFVINSCAEIMLSGKQEFFGNYLMNSSNKIMENYAKRISYGNFPLYVTEIGVILAFLIMLGAIVFLNDASADVIISSLAAIALIVLRLVPQLNKVLISMYAINVCKQKVFWFIEKYEQISKFGYEKLQSGAKMPFNFAIRLEDAGLDFGIKNLSISIKKNEFLGVIGLSGAGKTTFANLLCGLYLPKTGKLFVDETEITKNNLFSWQKNISFLVQQPVFMNGSVIENIAFGEKIDIGKIKQALIFSGLDLNILNFPTCKNFSVGQKRRIALARAFYRNFEVLILDEATSALDNHTQNMVVENIAELKGKKTIIAIAHRIETLKKCDRIICFENGEIKYDGSFDELPDKFYQN